MKALWDFILLMAAVAALWWSLNYLATNDVVSLAMALLCAVSVGVSWVSDL